MLVSFLGLSNPEQIVGDIHAKELKVLDHHHFSTINADLVSFLVNNFVFLTLEINLKLALRSRRWQMSFCGIMMLMADVNQCVLVTKMFQR